MNDSPANSPSPFIERWLTHQTSAHGRALDVACGRGRHALLLARHGYRVTAIDNRLDALASLRASAQRETLPIAPLCTDLTHIALPHHRFDLIVVTRYLDRDFFGALRDALVPGGMLLYETFTEHQLRYDRGPRSPAHLLKPGELRGLMQGMDLCFDEEVMEPEAVARVAARRRAAND